MEPLRLRVSPQSPDLPARFESLNDDTLSTILQFVGKKSYKSFGGLNKQCKEIYLNTPGMTKETFLFGYAPLSIIQDKHANVPLDRWGYNYTFFYKMGEGVVLYNRRDVLDWIIQERNSDVLKEICKVAVEEGRIDLLDEVWNNVNDKVDKRDVFQNVDWCAARCGKLNVLKWFETKEINIDKEGCAIEAARYGQLHILQWLKEEKGLKLNGYLYGYAARDGQLHVMKWLREQGCPFYERTFTIAAEEGNLAILQWLHDEGCPWPEDDDDKYLVYESWLEPEAIDWLHSNGYGDRIIYEVDDDY